ncbi:uncharacterized protein PAC_03642 [Phialocephala subalpina]|uniref:LicD/FKTN/FKRP nucleotidyltransferase domain-containing protein n=1 Tax=Phialocephala subalpina TaxID=576137 RepID=A0A1L7WLW2_9HELO|nr:uncharacterized protein PAC_03642 [Phialocephala subalpina]
MKLTTLFTLPFLLTPLLAAPSPNPNPEPVVNQPFRGKTSPKQQQHHDTKYFHEPGGDDELGHFDIRYFKGKVSYEERGDTLYHLIRSYLTVFREKNIETWIAHGTLLGWWWNGKIMPWDWDLDTQVSASTLTWLGQNLNMTFHKYTSTNPNGNTPGTPNKKNGSNSNKRTSTWQERTSVTAADHTCLEAYSQTSNRKLGWGILDDYYDLHTEDEQGELYKLVDEGERGG